MLYDTYCFTLPAEMAMILVANCWRGAKLSCSAQKYFFKHCSLSKNFRHIPCCGCETCKRRLSGVHIPDFHFNCAVSFCLCRLYEADAFC